MEGWSRERGGRTQEKPTLPPEDSELLHHLTPQSHEAKRAGVAQMDPIPADGGSGEACKEEAGLGLVAKDVRI